MTTAATVPALPPPGRQARVIFTLTAGGNYVRVWCTIAPDGSELALKLTNAIAARVLVYQGDGGAALPWLFDPDKGGKYTLLAQEYTRGSGYGGGYQSDPAGAESETKVGSEATLVVFVGQRLSSRIGIPPDDAKLVVWVWNDAVCATTLAIHGEVTPAVVAPSPSPRAKAAMESASVRAALLVLGNASVGYAVGNLAAFVTDFRGYFAGHIALGGPTHANVDAVNGLLAENSSSPTPKSLPAFVNDALRLLRRHMQNDTGAGPGSAGALPFHFVATNVADQVNAPLYTTVSDLEDAYGALADLWRAYEAHRNSVAVHGAVDSTNFLGTLPPILAVHAAYLQILAALDPAVPPAQSTGAMKLISQAGFVET